MTRTRQDTLTAFRRLVNMSPERLAEWLQSRRARMAGTGEGIVSGRKLVPMLLSLDAHKDWTPSEWRHAARTVGFIGRHLRSTHLFGPEVNLSGYSRRHISLRNWGHDAAGSPADLAWLQEHPGAYERRGQS